MSPPEKLNPSKAVLLQGALLTEQERRALLARMREIFGVYGAALAKEQYAWSSTTYDFLQLASIESTLIRNLLELDALTKRQV